MTLARWGVPDEVFLADWQAGVPPRDMAANYGVSCGSIRARASELSAPRHQPGKLMPTIAKGSIKTLSDLEHRCIPEPNSGCWLYLYSLDRKGYAHLQWKGRFTGGHRVAYELAHGQIPDGLHIDHLCRVRCCCNPAHLEAVTTQENTRRGNLGAILRARHAAVTHCPNGHDYSAANLLSSTDKFGITRRRCRECARAKYRAWSKNRVRTRRGGLFCDAPV